MATQDSDRQKGNGGTHRMSQAGTRARRVSPGRAWGRGALLWLTLCGTAIACGIDLAGVGRGRIRE